MAAVNRAFVALESATGRVNGAGYHPCQGIWYTSSNANPKIAFIASHYQVDYSEHYLAEMMARRGAGFLGWNTRYRNNDGWFLLEHALFDIGAGVKWLRDVVKADTIVLLGNCGGGSLMAAYQSQATAPSISPSHGLLLPPPVCELEAADLYVSLQSHLGRAEVLTSCLDPSVTDEADPLCRRPELDMFDPDNGPPYSDEFVRNYRQAQIDRNERITTWALAELDRCNDTGAFDRNFNVHRTWADPRFLDAALDRSERKIGTCLAGSPRFANWSPFSLAANSTLRTWLGLWSLSRSQCRSSQHLPRIEVPALVIQSTADVGVFLSDARSIHEQLGSNDKALHFIDGDHYLENPSDARENAADLIWEWVKNHAS